MSEKQAGQNPLKFDPELKALLEKLDFIKTGRSFKRWKGSFLSRFQSFLEEAGVDAAEKAYRDFSTDLNSFTKIVNKVEEFVEKGELQVDKYTVKARNCLNEMSKTLTEIILKKDALIPQTNHMEKQRGYNKFHMGAVLVRDNFDEYGRLSACGDILKHMRKVSLQEFADKQLLEAMDQYGVTLQKFCDVMADLGIYEVMMKCLQFADDDDKDDDFVFLDLKTGGIGEVSRELCMSKKLINVIGQDEQGHDLYQEAAQDDENKEKLLKLMKDSKKLGLGFGQNDNQYAEESVNLDAEKIKSMWGITLKKTPKNVKGEEFLFVDLKSGQYGELSRKLFIEHEVITEIKDEKGKFAIGEALQDFEERANMIESLRAALSLGIKRE